MNTKNYGRVLVDIFTMAHVGGQGDFNEVANHFVNAIEEYNERNGTVLILSMEDAGA